MIEKIYYFIFYFSDLNIILSSRTKNFSFVYWSFIKFGQNHSLLHIVKQKYVHSTFCPPPNSHPVASPPAHFLCFGCSHGTKINPCFFSLVGPEVNANFKALVVYNQILLQKKTLIVHKLIVAWSTNITTQQVDDGVELR